VILGLDMRFSGERWQKKNNGDGKGNRISYFVAFALV
jgi:hypothetical protein